MTYRQYISLGFIREDVNDEVEFDNTGYRGFFLKKEITSKFYFGVSSSNLDKPKLYVKKRNEDKYHITIISDEFIMDSLDAFKLINN
jgi:hypothetical protein